MKLRIKYAGDLVSVSGLKKSNYKEFTAFDEFLATINSAITNELSYINFIDRQAVINISLTTKKQKGIKKHGKL